MLVGERVSLEFIGRPMSTPAGMILWPGTECPVPLNAFPFRILQSNADSTVFELHQFPPGPVSFSYGKFVNQPLSRRPDGSNLYTSNGRLTVLVRPKSPVVLFRDHGRQPLIRFSKFSGL